MQVTDGLDIEVDPLPHLRGSWHYEDLRTAFQGDGLCPDLGFEYYYIQCVSTKDPTEAS